MALTRSPRRSPATTVAEWNKVTGSHVDESVVVDALEELRVQGWLTAAPPPLAEAEASFLTTHGGVRDDREALVRARVASRVRAVTVDGGNMTVDQVAELLGVSASRVRHRIGEGSIYAYPSTRHGVARRIPYWQFHDRLPIPHLASVLAELPDDYRPSETRDFVLNAEVDDPVRDTTTVPLLEWLRGGGDPEPARELAAAQHYVI